MRKCIAYCIGGDPPRRWVPCPRRADHGAALCRMHAEAVSGVLYGLGVFIRGVVSKSDSPDAKDPLNDRNLKTRIIQ